MTDQRVVYVPVTRQLVDELGGEWSTPVHVRFVYTDRNLVSLEVRQPDPPAPPWWRRILRWRG